MVVDITVDVSVDGMAVKLVGGRAGLVKGWTRVVVGGNGTIGGCVGGGG